MTHTSEELAQVIQDMYFEDGAVINYDTWRTTLAVITTAKRETLREVMGKIKSNKRIITDLLWNGEPACNCISGEGYCRNCVDLEYNEAIDNIITHLESKLTV